MNDSENSRPRLICRLVRRWESSRGPVSGEGHTPLTARHMEKCEACREFFADDVAFEQSLRRAAGAVKAEPRAGFEQRILRAVRESEAPVATRTRTVSARSWGISLAAAAAGVALALVFFQRSDGPEESGPSLAGNRPAPGTQEVVTPDISAGSQDEPSLQWLASAESRQSALELAKRNPLEDEIDSVYHDAQAVLGFLALNFLPSSATSSDGDSTKLPRETGAAREG